MTAFREETLSWVVDEIKYWHFHHGIYHFSFYDDALLVDPGEMAIPLFKEVIRRNLPVHFHCPNGLHLLEITSEVIILMFKAGFRTVRFGFETSDVEHQTTTGGKVDNKELQEAVLHLKRTGYRGSDIGVYILCGLPGQYANEVQESIEFVLSCGARPIIAEHSPIPGTELWSEAVSLSPYPITEEHLFHNNSLLPCRSDRLSYEMDKRLKLLTRKPVRDEEV